jgi:hypothetical protein
MIHTAILLYACGDSQRFLQSEHRHPISLVMIIATSRFSNEEGDWGMRGIKHRRRVHDSVVLKGRVHQGPL